MKENNQVVISGYGPIGSTGIGKHKFWEGLISQDIGLNKVYSERFHDEYSLHKVAKFNIDDFDILDLDLKSIYDWKGGPDIELEFISAAIKLAMDDAKISSLDTKGIGVIITHENPSLEILLNKFFEIVDQKIVSPSQIYSQIVKSAYETQSFMLLHHLCKIFKLREFPIYINNACASGLYALELGRHLIQNGRFSKVIIASADCPDIFKVLWFKSLSLYAEDGKTKPFSNSANGFVLGEGAAAVVLENMSSARNRKSELYSEYLGGDCKVDNWKITVPAPHLKTLNECVIEAMRCSSVEAHEIDVICAHGVGTKINDMYEARMIKDVFHELNTPVVALKAYLGHNLGGCSLLEVCAMLLMMEKNMILPNLHPTDDKYSLNLISKIQVSDVSCFMKICSAFAGFHSASVFRRTMHAS